MAHDAFPQNENGQSGSVLPYLLWENEREMRQTRLLLDLDDREVFHIARAYQEPVEAYFGEPVAIRSYVMDVEGAFCSLTFTDREHATFFLLRGSLVMDAEFDKLDERDKDFAKFLMASLTREVPEELTASNDTTFYGVRDTLVDGAYLALHMAFPAEMTNEAIEAGALNPTTMIHRHYADSDFYIDPAVVLLKNRIYL